MKKVCFAVVLMMGSIQCYAQDAVSGYVNTQEPEEKEQEVVISVIEPDNKVKAISTVQIRENGFFAFPEAIFSSKDQVYKIHMKPDTSDANNETGRFRTFILSKGDRLYFSESGEAFGSYSSTNKADKEWLKFKRFEDEIHETATNGTDAYLDQTRNYTKDSLQILLVKLLSIKTLEDKKLLERDITENADFYLDLLEKLQDSDLEPASYAFLETKITATHQDIIQRRYQFSLFFNFIGVVAILLLTYMLIRLRRKPVTAPSLPLSKQEENIKKLILEGKSNKQIAAELYISMSTVKTHISHIYNKLNVSNRKELGMK